MTQLFVSTVESINECFQVLNCYEKSSGAKVNKTKLYVYSQGHGKIKYPFLMKFNGKIRQNFRS